VILLVEMTNKNFDTKEGKAFPSTKQALKVVGYILNYKRKDYFIERMNSEMKFPMIDRLFYSVVAGFT
jgi:hypothetical protein